jgi:predicted RNase H-like HicB family nuclease
VKRYLVVVEWSGRNYSAYSPDVEGCVATGDTLGEVIDNMQSALKFHLEGILLRGEEIPEGSQGTTLYMTIEVPEGNRLPA